MERKVIYIETNSTDPAYNLAVEQYVFDVMPKDQDYFWLWQNDNTIVVGKHQNTIQEINQEYVKAHGIKVVRRLSGGGAVYHDMGNVNFTFITNAGNLEQLNLQAFCMPVVRTLEKIGVKAEVSGRNDISIDGKKFSGNSQYVKQGRIMHHGTLMFDSDLSVVSQALNVTQAKYESKGFKSVKSRVTNIRPYATEGMTMEQFKQILKENMTQPDTVGADGMIKSSAVEIYHLTSEDEAEIQKIKQERYDTWEWTYGSSPKYSVTKKRRFDGCGQLELCMNVEEGKITDIQIFGDFFGNGMTETLKQSLIGCEVREEEIRKVLEQIDLQKCFVGLEKEDFVSLLVL